MEADTVPLRSAAARWSLEGDSQLLSVLQSLHQTIITKCQETNTQLDAMVSALDNASIDLQNVNNKFMALSNSQFVESRVYEDEVELTDNTKQNSPKPEAQSSLSSLKIGLQVLESLHEAVAIVDSDSDEEHSPRRVLRPRGRGRLPPVVGSQAWRDAPHAGLWQGSDSDSSAGDGASALEQYSDSDTDHTASSSSLPSMTSHAPPVTSHAPPVTSHTPSGHDAHTEERSPEPDLDESPLQRPLYSVERHMPAPAPAPAPVAHIFRDEPPPVSFEADSDDDIFAELHKQPYPHSNKSHNVADDLFGSGPYETRNKDDNVIRNTVTNTVEPARENSPLFSSPEEPESKKTPNRETYAESGVKKPVGGISLFGSKGSESIGAAILKRNQKQSSSESDGTSTQTRKPNIIEDLFTKPVKNIKKESAIAKTEPVVKEAVKDKILFSDNIFDDIDDIFTTKVITKTKDPKDKISVFDDDLFEADKSDNNDLFNDKSKPVHKSRKDTKEKVKSIFDSDSEDDLFSDFKLTDNNLKTNTNNKTLINNNVTTHTHTHREKKTELKEPKTDIKVDRLQYQLSPNILDDDFDDKEDDLFGNNIQSKDDSRSKAEIEVSISDGKLNSEEEQHGIKSEITRNNEVIITEAETKVLRLENEGIEEKYISGTTSIDISIPASDDDVIIAEESEADKDDVEKLPVVKQNNEIEVTAVVSDSKVPSLPKIDFLEEAKHPKEDISREVSEQNHSRDMFVDIFDDLPPAFDKPMEPKRSKNVNALFDDDSDDEALFFKKDDVITDEKPDLEFKSDRFQIFHDEPPDIDVDFSQKFRNTNQIPDNFDLPDQENIVNVTKVIGNTTKEEPSIMKTEKPTEGETRTGVVQNENKHHPDNVNSEGTSNNEIKSKTDILKLLESEGVQDIIIANKDIVEDIFSDLDKNDSNEETSKSDIKDSTNKDDTESSESEKKPVGRLRPLTINIHVSSLLPGAVLKKSKSNEETDGQTASRSTEEYSPEITEPQMVKTVSFKGNLDSAVLDNKLSKERAKIQVKRRPSTRRARLEAVRRSGLDLGSDSTDNSSSFDEPVKEKHKNDKISVPYKKLNETKLNSEVNETNSDIKEVTSKVVYVLNDEDIFEAPPRSDDDLFNSKEDSPHYRTVKDTTQPLAGTVTEKQMIKVEKTKKSLFDDMSDDDTELFKKPVQKSVFDSDSESELFSGTNVKGKRESGSKVEQKKLKESRVDQKIKENKVTKALFSDDSDEDLFGRQTIRQTNRQTIRQTNKQTNRQTNRHDFKETSAPRPRPSATAAFEDPLCASRRHDA